MSEKTTEYYVPEQSAWPIIGAVGLFTMAIGAANFIQQNTDKVNNEGSLGGIILFVGAAIIIFMMFGWFATTIKESLAGKNSSQMDMSYRMGMGWFIFSEVMFFAAFFGALYYARMLVVPWLGGAGSNAMTHEILWPNFQAIWPLTLTPEGEHLESMGPWGLPAINTALLLSSGVTLTIAHHALLAGERNRQIIFLALTVALGVIFLGLQAFEYHHAYAEMGLTLGSGIYGSTFFMLTGFHGFHVTIGAIMLTVMTIRSIKGHLTPENHFAFEATAWYWHFVDVVWLFLFVVVYWF